MAFEAFGKLLVADGFVPIAVDDDDFNVAGHFVQRASLDDVS